MLMQRLSWCILPCICAHRQQGVVMQVGVAKGALSEAKEKAWVRAKATSDWKRPRIGGEVGGVDDEEYERVAMPKLITVGRSG